MLLAVKRPQNRGTKGKRYPTKRKYFDNSEYTRLNGVKRIVRMSGACVVTWLSGCGTTRGAISIRGRRLEVDERGELVRPLRRVSCLRVSCGAGVSMPDVAATAMGSSAGSPSKNRAIAIC